LDEILQKKTAYLNLPFWLIRFAVYFIIWSFFAVYLRKISVRNDYEPYEKYLKRIRSASGWFMVLFAITSSMAAWDWLMSIDAHWFSTLYGWYIFSSMFVAALAVIIIIAVAFKELGILPNINKEHLHDLGKYLFGFSIFWAYMWLSQYLLIWYSNIPEETIYYVERTRHFETLFILNLVVNFVFPLMALMTRNSKRQPLILVTVALVVLLGHYLDLYLAIMPGAVGHEAASIGILEIGLPFFYLAVFMILFFTYFKKAKPVPENHPYIIESSNYENL
ncbi:MAG: quinol:cytochrome C oxidoreductase, partial [Tangfeifania sp.]